MPMFFLNSTGAEEISASGTSYLNRTEARRPKPTRQWTVPGGVSKRETWNGPWDGCRSCWDGGLAGRSGLGGFEMMEREGRCGDRHQWHETSVI